MVRCVLTYVLTQIELCLAANPIRTTRVQPIIRLGRIPIHRQTRLCGSGEAREGNQAGEGEGRRHPSCLHVCPLQQSLNSEFGDRHVRHVAHRSHSDTGRVPPSTSRQPEDSRRAQYPTESPQSNRLRVACNHARGKNRKIIATPQTRLSPAVNMRLQRVLERGLCRGASLTHPRRRGDPIGRCPASRVARRRACPPASRQTSRLFVPDAAYSSPMPPLRPGCRLFGPDVVGEHEVLVADE